MKSIASSSVDFQWTIHVSDSILRHFATNVIAPQMYLFRNIVMLMLSGISPSKKLKDQLK